MKLKLIEKRDEANATKSFFWQPDSAVSFAPGQYFYYTLPKLNYEDPRGATRHFTIASSPIESNLLRLTTKIRQESGYKKTLDELPIGSEIEGQGPNGVFTFDETETGPHVFISGGIGITPFRSMINYDILKNLKIPIYLLYSCSNQDEVAFKDELDGWDKNCDYFTMKVVVTSQEGRIDQEKIKNFLLKNNIQKPTFWVCGPPPFIDAMEAILREMGVLPDNIRSEKFTGY